MVLPVVGVALAGLLALLPARPPSYVAAGPGRRLVPDPADLGHPVVRLRAALACPTARRVPAASRSRRTHGSASLAVAVARADVVDAPWPAFVALGGRGGRRLARRAPPRCCATCGTVAGCGRPSRLRSDDRDGLRRPIGRAVALRMREPYLLRSGERCVVITLHEKYLPLILDGADLTSPLVQLGSRGTRDLDVALRAVDPGRVLRPERPGQQGLHGPHEPDPRVAQPRRLRQAGQLQPAPCALSTCWSCAGRPASIAMSVHGIRVEPEQFRVLGRPQASDVRPARGPIAELESKVVLYAPTWQGVDESVNFSSLEKGPEIVRALIAARRHRDLPPASVEPPVAHPAGRHPGDPRDPARRQAGLAPPSTSGASPSATPGPSSTAPTARTP